MKQIARTVIVTVCLALMAAPLSARPNEFKNIVNHIKKQYNAKQIRIPFVFGLVGLGARFYTRGAIKGLKIAVFEDQDFSQAFRDKGLDSIFATNFDASWVPMLKSYSKLEASRTYIYAREEGKDFRILLTTMEADNAVVISAKLNPAQLAKFIERHREGDSILSELNLGAKRKKRDERVTVQAESAAVNPKSEAVSIGDASVVADAPVEKNDGNTNNVNANQNANQNDVTTVGNNNPTVPALKADLSIDTKLINLNVKVLNQVGKPITSLQKDDFILYENNVRQEISHFSPVTAPLNLVLLLDYSSSTKDKKKVMKEAAKKFVDSLGPNDRLAVAVFGRRMKVMVDFSADKKLLKKKIDKIDYDASGTGYYDAMWSTLDLFQRVDSGRNAIVVLTDGVDNSISQPKSYEPKHGFNTLLERMAEDDVTIYPLYLDTEYDMVVKRRGSDTHETYAIARKQLAQVAEQTGGSLYTVARIEDLEGVYDRVAAELKTLYSVAYSSSLDDGSRPKQKEWRAIQLEIKQPNAIARTKRGYFAK